MGVPILAESDLELEQGQDLLFGQEQYSRGSVRKVPDVLYMDNVAEKPHQVASETSDSRPQCPITSNEVLGIC